MFRYFQSSFSWVFTGFFFRSSTLFWPNVLSETILVAELPKHVWSYLYLTKPFFSPNLASPENYQAVSPENKEHKTPGTSEIQTFWKKHPGFSFAATCWFSSLGLCGVIRVFGYHPQKSSKILAGNWEVKSLKKKPEKKHMGNGWGAAAMDPFGNHRNLSPREIAGRNLRDYSEDDGG